MASSLNVKLACVAILCMVVVAPHAVTAITCGQVASSIAPCFTYLTKGGAPSPGCCNGVKALVRAATTTADRQTACKCLKSSAGSIKGINYANAASLPGKCGTSVSYPISPSTDCSKVQ